MTIDASIAHQLKASAQERAKQIPVRVVLAILIAWSLYAAGHVDWVAPWFALSAAVQAFEYFGMAGVRRAEGPVGRTSMITALVAVGLMSGIHAALAAGLWLSGLPALVTVAVLILCGGLLNNVASAGSSRPLFFLGAAPYLAALVFMPVVVTISGVENVHLPLLLMAVCLFSMGMFSVWNRVNGARKAEAQAREEAERRLEVAEAAMADRAAMAAIVSHELRTPVSAILAGAHVIRHGDRPESTDDTADLIIDAGRLMTGMLNDLLDHSKIEARAMTLEARDFDLTAFVQDTARFWAAPAAQKGLAFVAPEPAEPLWLRGDPYRLRQILNNLLSNALKFTSAGTVAFEAATRASGEGRFELRLTVRDQGQGIAPDAMARLFAPFAQGSAEVARTYGGTGLGLTVSRDLARLMGGELVAVSEPGQGAAFTLTVELEAGSPVKEADAFDAPPLDLNRRLKVLAVDDHEINRRTLALVLQPLEVELTTACDGQSALEVLADQVFDVVLMDVNMPGIDGNEATRRLRASDGPNATVPVIGFSAGAEPAQVQACRDAGMTDWLPKPLEPRRLYEALDRAVSAVNPAPAEHELEVA